MAIWQVTMALTKEDESLCYQEKNFLDSLNDLNMFFPEKNSWCESIRQFGDLDSTCMEIDYKQVELSLRIDLRNITKEQLEAIIKFAISNGLKVKYNNMVVSPSFESFVNIIKSSNAYKFINDPNKYLETLVQSGDGSVIDKRD